MAEAYTEGLNAETAGKTTELGQIEVNEHLQTSASNIYAIGDVVVGPVGPQTKRRV